MCCSYYNCEMSVFVGVNAYVNAYALFVYCVMTNKFLCLELRLLGVIIRKTLFKHLSMLW